MWWGSCPDHTRLHAVAPCDIEVAPERGWTEALCGRQLPIDVPLLSGPSGDLCLACVIGATADLADATEQLGVPNTSDYRGEAP